MRCRHNLFDPSGCPVSTRRLLNYPHHQESCDMLGCLERSSPSQGNNGPVVVFTVHFYSSGFLLSWLLLG